MKQIVLLLVLPLLAFTTAHKFYVSVTNIKYAEKDDSIQITTRIFIDDLEQLMKERYGIKTHLGTDDEAVIADDYIKKYFKSKFAVELDGKIVPYTFLGKRYEDDVVICYFEIENVAFQNLKKIAVQNELLTDLFDEQQNLVHFKWKGKKRSFILMKENNKGMLNL